MVTFPGESIGPISNGHDFNYYEEISVAITDGYFPSIPQAIVRFRGGGDLMFVCKSGSLTYSFNGYTTHGAIDSAGPDDLLYFTNRPNKKIWFKGTGTVRVHAWRGA